MARALDNNHGTHGVHADPHSEPQQSDDGKPAGSIQPQSRMQSQHALLDNMLSSNAGRSPPLTTNRLGGASSLRRSASMPNLGGAPSGTSLGSTGIALPPSRHRTPAATLNPGTPGNANTGPGQHAPVNHASPHAQHGAAHANGAHQMNHAGANDGYGQQRPSFGERLRDELPGMASSMADTMLNYAQAAINIEKSMAAAVEKASEKV